MNLSVMMGIALEAKIGKYSDKKVDFYGILDKTSARDINKVY